MNKIENNIYFSNLRKTEKGKTKKKKKYHNCVMF